MNKNFRVITINGFRGMFTVIFIVCGLICGFLISPAWACMKLWNYFFKDSLMLPHINLFQGLLLWGMIVLSLYILNNNRPLICFGSYHGLPPEKIKEIMRKAKADDLNTADISAGKDNIDSFDEIIRGKEQRENVAETINEEAEVKR